MLESPILAASFSFRTPPPQPGGCGGAVGCGLAGVVPELMVLGAFVGLLAGLATFVHLQDAKPLVATEREQILAERDAFESFAERVASLTPTTSPAMQSPPLRPSGGSSTDADAVLDAYRDTVMAVSHYDDEYGEPIAANMAAELGTDVTTALRGDDSFSQPVQQTLVSRAHAAADQRRTFAETLETEADALDAAEDAFAGFVDTVDALDDKPLSEKSYDQLAETWRRLRSLEADCEAKLQERQREIQNSVIETGPGTGDGSTTLPEYLYNPLDVSHPVLADGLAVLDTLRESRSRVSAALASR